MSSSKKLKAQYIPKFKRELGEGVCTEQAILSMITQMHNVGLITFSQASTITDCLWIAKSELRKRENEGGQS